MSSRFVRFCLSKTVFNQRAHSIRTFRRQFPMRNLKQWPLTESEHSPRCISCVVHGSIPLFHPLEMIVDTAEFQRLRRLKQMGLAHMVYPCAEHSRFTHSLGAYHLAWMFANQLRTSDPSLNITCDDVLCISIAGLCHDIGHGPFSHMFDHEFIPEKKPNVKWSHEDGSLKLIHKIFHEERVKHAFAPFLGTGTEYEQNLTFIKELIHADKKVDSNGRWLLEGRGREKSFLYDIVSNSEDGHDVDKFDYLLRDSLHSNVNITFGMNSVNRLRNNMRVLMCPERNYSRICYAKKVHNDLMAVGNSRQELHATVYQHYTVRSIERMVVDAIILADQHLQFVGENRNRYSLSETIHDMTAYVRTDDTIVQLIENSSDESPEMVKAREILSNVHKRNIPKLIEKADFSPSKINRVVMDGKSIDAHSNMFKHFIRQKLVTALEAELPGEHITVLMRNLNRGLDGKRHPAGEVLVFDNKKGFGEAVAERMEPNEVTMRAPADPTIMSVAVFADKTVCEEKRHRVREIFDMVVREHGLRSAQTSRNTSPVQSPISIAQGAQG